ncbi:MAG TPA: polyprenyl synthetase family protein [Gaiellaceae bacterium]|nr:polyprenyl synthetase family protein [Gaiellaceae bacterium]
MRSVDELRALVEDALAELSPAGPAGLDEAVRYALEGGGKRIRPVLCLAVGEAIGAAPEEVLPAACALELVHSFSLVHDDLPALDDDDTRRGRPSTWAQFGESVAVLAGDALLVEAFQLALSYETPAVASELADATLGMIGGQYLDVTGSADDVAALNRLKTGRLFEASVALALAVRGSEPQTWPRFAQEVGALFQLVDDLLDGDGHVLVHGVEETRRQADEAAERALAALAELDVDTSVLRALVEGLATRSA